MSDDFPYEDLTDRKDIPKQEYTRCFNCWKFIPVTDEPTPCPVCGKPLQQEGER